MPKFYLVGGKKPKHIKNVLNYLDFLHTYTYKHFRNLDTAKTRSNLYVASKQKGSGNHEFERQN